MSINSEPIASPKKGQVAGKVMPQTNLSGQALKIGAFKKSSVADQLLVNAMAGGRLGSRAEMLANIKQGLKFSTISQLEAAFGASQKEVAKVLSITPATLTRRKKEGRLHADESDRVIRLARLKDLALTLMNGEDAAAISWLRTRLEILGGETPLEHASTEMGARDVEDLIGRLRHGVFS